MASLLAKIASDLNIFFLEAKLNAPFLLKILAFVWLLNIISWSLGLGLNRYGLIPRKRKGLIGIFTATFLHANFNHLFFNTIPFIALGLFIIALGINKFYEISLIIILFEGITVWLFGRSGNHIGASSLISGYFSYVIISAYRSPTIATILAAIIAIYYFGSIFLSLFPNEEKQSWEGHLLGFIGGIIAYNIHLPINFLNSIKI